MLCWYKAEKQQLDVPTGEDVPEEPFDVPTGEELPELPNLFTGAPLPELSIDTDLGELSPFEDMDELPDLSPLEGLLQISPFTENAQPEAENANSVEMLAETIDRSKYSGVITSRLFFFLPLYIGIFSCQPHLFTFDSAFLSTGKKKQRQKISQNYFAWPFLPFKNIFQCLFLPSPFPQS